MALNQRLVKKLVREPLVHFAIGAVTILVCFELFSNQSNVSGSSILIDKKEVELIVSKWQQRWHRPPTEQEMEDQIAHIVEQELLFREGKALGLDQDDLFVRNRVIQKVEHLIDASIAEPSENDLQQWFANNSHLYPAEPRVYFEQILLKPSYVEYGNFEELLIALNQNTLVASAIERSIEGIPRVVDAMELKSVSSLFGSEYAKELIKISQSNQDWQGPIFGGFGVHLVRNLRIVHVASSGLDDEQIRREVVNDWIANQKTLARERKLLELAKQIDIKIER